MADRVSSGQPIPRSANLWNNIIGSANEYASRLLGQPSGTSSQPNPTDVVKIKNSRGSHIRLGEVLEISGFLLTNVLRTSLWFEGSTPDATHPFCIALQDIPIASIDRAQVSGACVAWVNVTNANHGYAQVTNGNVVLQSSSDGPVRILYKPTGTGEKMCAVLLGAQGASGLKGGCLAQNHPGRGIAFDIRLGVWDSAQDKWIYAEAGTTVKAIDWRYGVPYPDAGATGLFESRSSDTYVTLYETVALDCSSPGACGT
jgi:hypothetical protein